MASDSVGGSAELSVVQGAIYCSLLSNIPVVNYLPLFLVPDFQYIVSVLYGTSLFGKDHMLEKSKEQIQSNISTGEIQALSCLQMKICHASQFSLAAL